MYFLGAIIGGTTDEEAEAIASPYAAMEMPEHVVWTCDEFLRFRRNLDRLRLKGGLRNSKGAAERLEMGDMDAAKAYAKLSGFTLDEEGNVLGTYNENAFYEWCEFDVRLPKGMERIQGATCRELLELCDRDGDAHAFVEGLHVACFDGGYTGVEARGVPWSSVSELLEGHADDDVRFVEFHVYCG